MKKQILIVALAVCLAGCGTTYQEATGQTEHCRFMKKARIEKMNESLKDFGAWNEVTKGLYRYVIAAGACYEIHILYHDKTTDILSANASLYIAEE